MSTYTIQGASESIYSYVRRRWDEMRDNLEKGLRPAVTNDDAGADAAARYIFVELKKNPSAVTEALPPDYTYIKKVIVNPSNPLTWVTQKAGQAIEKAEHTVAVNMDKPAQLLSDIGAALPWYVKPGAIVGLLAASILLPRLLEGYMKGRRGAKSSSLSEKFSGLRRKLKV